MALRLMCITAHPDDESGAFGGALLRAHQQGAKTSVVCLTDGQAAAHRGDTNADAELGRVRREEFAAALHVLGVSDGEVLGYPDGRLPEQSFSEVALALVERIRCFRPQVVLSFGGDGGVNRHPDHTMACLFATAAFHWAGRAVLPGEAASAFPPYTPQKLYYSSTPFLAADTEETGKTALVPASLFLDLRDLKATKHEAFRRHTTQAPVLERAAALFDKYAGEEQYLLVAARGLHHELKEAGIFAGIVED